MTMRITLHTRTLHFKQPAKTSRGQYTSRISRYVVVESGGSVGEAMDHLLVTKVLRKLKDRHDVRAAALEELNEQILTSWAQLDNVNLPERCLALIESEIAAKKGEELV